VEIELDAMGDCAPQHPAAYCDLQSLTTNPTGTYLHQRVNQFRTGPFRW
jgi:hypothetical protein